MSDAILKSDTIRRSSGQTPEHRTCKIWRSGKKSRTNESKPIQRRTGDRDTEGGRGHDGEGRVRQHNISEPTYDAWKRKYGGLEVSEARRLHPLEEECGRLKRLVVDQAVQIQK